MSLGKALQSFLGSNCYCVQALLALTRNPLKLYSLWSTVKQVHKQPALVVGDSLPSMMTAGHYRPLLLYLISSQQNYMPCNQRYFARCIVRIF